MGDREQEIRDKMAEANTLLRECYEKLTAIHHEINLMWAEWTRLNGLTITGPDKDGRRVQHPEPKKVTRRVVRKP